MEWKKTNNRVVAFFDIMGFKNLVQNKSHNEILKKMQHLSQVVSLIDNYEFKAHGAKSGIKTIIFSDSVILVSENDTISSAINVMLHSSIIMKNCFEIGMPIKGCISHGKFTADFDKSLFFGQPLIDAYLLQEELFVYSIILHHSFEAKFSSNLYGGNKICEGRRWFKYDTPLKSGLSSHYHQNWLFYSDHLYDKKKKQFIRNEKGIEEIYTQLNRFYLTVSGRPRIYIDNTKRLVEKLIEYTLA